MSAKKALSVGINQYSNPEANLRGCVNDSIMIREILRKHFGFKNSDITLLLDHQATQANIIKELHNLVKDAKKGDILVFHYSGHGSNIVDYDGDELDGFDEIICPYDMDWSNPLSDDKINKILKTEKGVNLTMIMDCCHSGTVNKNFCGPDMSSPVKDRYLFPPTALIPNQRERNELTRRTFHSQKKNYSILISGCEDNQTSADAWIDGAYHGAFTFYLNETLRKNKWKMEMGDLHEQVIEALAYHNYTQRPVLGGPKGVEKQEFLSVKK